MGDVMNYIAETAEMFELQEKQIEVQNRITELNELKEAYTCLNNGTIDLYLMIRLKLDVRVLLYCKEILNISDKRQRYFRENTPAALSNSGSGHRSSLSE